MYELRPYQKEAKDAVLSEWKKGNRKTLLVLPTGCGKTIVFASITEECVKKGHRVLVMAHREELLSQAADKLKKASGLDSVLEQGMNHSFGSNLPVTIGSVQTMARKNRLSVFPKDYFDEIIVDEAHHCLSETYQRVLEHFPDANILGVTATPDRGDMRDLGEFFDSRAYEYSLQQAVRDEYLCRIKAQMIPLKLDIRNVGVSAGDFKANELGNALTPFLEQIAEKMKKFCEGRKTVVFMPLIAMSQEFCQILNDKGVSAIEVNGGSFDREKTISDFENGKYSVLVNSLLLTEGWDCPSVDCIVVLRPTKSRSLYCLDEKTEVLTSDGWRSDVEVGEKVAAFDKETGEIRFVEALAKVRRPLGKDEYFCSISGPSIDIRVTNHHRMLYDDRKRRGWKIKEAECLTNRKSTSYIPVSGNGMFKGVPLTDAELTFIGWVMTDGCINKNNNAIYISQSESHVEYCEEIEKCLTDCGFKHARRTVKRSGVTWNQNGDNVIWSISKGKPRGTDKNLEGWGRLDGWISKDLSPALYDMTAEQFDVMLQAINHGDGRKTKWPSYHISKGNKTFIERLQIMAIQRGYRASVSLEKVGEKRKDLWTLHIKKRDYTTANYPKWVREPHSEEMCWCVQNELGTLVTRRNGKVAIVGNCQMIGRGTRLSPGKKDLLILDFLWLTEKHDLCHPTSLTGMEQNAAQKIAGWMRNGDIIDLLEAKEMAERDILSERENALKRKLMKASLKNGRLVDPLWFAVSIGAGDLVDYEPTFDWEKKRPTEKQIAYLTKCGICTDDIKCSGYASELIGRIIKRHDSGLSTPKQIQCLEKHGFVHVGTWTFKEASHMLDRLAANRWRMPLGIVPGMYCPGMIASEREEMFAERERQDREHQKELDSRKRKRAAAKRKKSRARK